MNPPDNIESPATDQPKAWSGRSRGGAFGTWFFINVVRLLGPWVGYVALVPVAAYFLVASPRGVRASAEYHRQLSGPIGTIRLIGRIYRHFYAFGVSLLDRFIMIGSDNSKMQIEHEGVEHLRAAIEAGKGVIMLGAHAGNWQGAGHLLQRYDTPVNLVVLENEAERIRGLTERAMPGRSFRVIGVDPEFSQSFEILAALRRGEIVALHGDRVHGGRAVRVPFLGREASFPAGPYLLAAASGAALVQVFAMREPGWRYRFVAYEADWLKSPRRTERGAFLNQQVGKYAARLEAMMRRYPYQWYNFFPFWEEPSEMRKDASARR